MIAENEGVVFNVNGGFDGLAYPVHGPVMHNVWQ